MYKYYSYEFRQYMEGSFSAVFLWNYWKCPQYHKNLVAAESHVITSEIDNSPLLHVDIEFT